MHSPDDDDDIKYDPDQRVHYIDDVNPGFVDHQPHHDDGAHIDHDPWDDFIPPYDSTATPNVDKFVPFDDLRRDFVDAFAHYYHTPTADTVATAQAAAARLAAALRHPSTGDR